MKNKLIYWGIAICIVLGFMACTENENWVVVTDVQPGVYVSGSSVIYKSVAPAASFKAAPFDPDTEERTGVSSLFTWLKADGDLFITKADASGVVTEYGKGETVSDITSGLIAGGSAFKVPTDGLYFLIYNNNIEQLTIIPAAFGVIGAATPNGWDAESPFTSTAYNEAAGTVEMKGTFPFTKDQMKFRFNSDWGIEVPYDASSVIKLHTNLGSIADSDGSIELTDGSTELKGGGKNFAIPLGAAYDVTLKLDLRNGKFSASVIQGEIIEPQFPENLYMIGDDFGSWNWESDGIVEMVPVNSAEGAFWCVSYFTAGKGFKWAPEKVWSGDFSQKGEAIGYTVSDGNAMVDTDGLYVVYIDLLNEKIAIEPAKIYGLGDAFGSWDEGKYEFAVDGNKLKISTTAAGNLRMYAGSSIATTAWWTREFNIFDGKIVYRGAGGDQDAVPVEAGKTITLDPKAGTATIE